MWVLMSAAPQSPAQSDSPGHAPSPVKLEYNKDIRPILSENCFACHGPDSAARKADLRLDQRDAAIEREAIVPGDPDASELLARIVSENEEEVMPPPSTNKKITPEQREILIQWIKQGAEYQPHWSFIPPKRTLPPEVSNPGWARNAIDRFLLKGLDDVQLQPASEADKRILVRRLSLDLIGLPPSPELVEAFEADTRPDAYERLVDRLMASPHWGEHRGRAWLDAARYADTHGYHFDNRREMWTYRDWVFNAFNANMPFDRFTTEQLAGDLLPNRTLDQQIASGFNRCNMTTNEGGTIPEENLVIYMKDRTETVGQVFLGLTVNCGGCHDHKFDPITQKDYYQLAAFFNNTTQDAMDGNIADTPPIIIVPRPEDRVRWEVVNAVRERTRQQIEERKAAARPEFDKWIGAADRNQLAGQIPGEGTKLRAALSPLDLANAGGPAAAPPALELADLGDFEKDQGFSISAWVKLPRGGMTGALVARMDDQNGYRGWDVWIENNRIGMHIVNHWDDDALKAVTDAELPANAWTFVTATYDGSGKAEGVKVYLNGEPRRLNVQKDQLKNSIKTNVPFKVAQRHTTAQLEGAAIHDLRVFARALPPDQVSQLAGLSRAVELVAIPAEKRPAEQVDAVFAWWLKTSDLPFTELQARLGEVEAEYNAIKARGSIAHVAQEKPEPAMAYVLYRGDYDKRRDQVSPETPHALPPIPSDAPRNRLGLAQWLLTRENPLTARVTVNRYWQEVFGQGLVRTAGDFGVAGELPSHPELLDWLALEFQDSGWDIKHMFRLMVTSAAYRQAAVATSEKLEKDPQNRLLSRGPRFRMDGEMVRDYALAVSGLLVETLGGPSVKPYQPDGVWEAVAMPESNTRFYKPDSGEKLYRRSVYTFWKRAAPPASMEIFNAPSREYCTVRRERTNTPLQALVTLNDPQFVEAARNLAERTLKEGCDCEGCENDESRVERMALRVLARKLQPEELAIVLDSIKQLKAYYQDHADDAAKLIAVGESKADPRLDPPTLAAWTMLANELLNLDEVICK
jgi:mono/diheme cytochrome c family protein